GQDWHGEIRAALEGASVAVLLVSADFLASPFIRREEVPQLLQRHARAGVRLFPVIVAPCAWQAVGWLGALQVRPRDGRPLAVGGPAQAEADLAGLATEIHNLLRATPAAPRAFVPLAPDRVSVSRLPVTGRHLVDRQVELAKLDAAWGDPKVNVVSLVAWGGV